LPNSSSSSCRGTATDSGQPAAEGIPAGGTLGGQPPAAGADNGDLGGILGGGGGLLTMLISFIGGGGGNDGGDESCDFFDQLLSFIGLANCSGGGASGALGGITGSGGGGLLETITGAFEVYFKLIHLYS